MSKSHIENSLIISEKIKNYLDAQKLKYIYNDERNQIILEFTLKGKIRNIVIRIDMDYKNGYMVSCTHPMNVDEQYYVEALRLINYINYSVVYGNYEMDEIDGEIRFRMSVDYSGSEPSNEMIDRSIFIPVNMMKKYGSLFVDIIMGYKTFEQIKEELKEED